MTEQFAPAGMGGFNEAIGLVLDEQSGDRVRGHVTVHPGLLQPYGIVHGGVYAALAETVASVGGALWHMGRVEGGRCVGVNNNTSFLRATRDGTISVQATPLHQGRTLQLWRVEMRDEQDRLIAHSEVRLANLAPDGPR